MAHEPLQHLQQALSGVTDEALAAWLQRGCQTWLETEGRIPLHRCLGLPAGGRARSALRDYWLARAAQRVDYCAARLQLAATRFNVNTWPVWRGLKAPPSSATALESCLFFARRASVFPVSQRQFLNIIGNSGNRKQNDQNVSAKLA